MRLNSALKRMKKIIKNDLTHMDLIYVRKGRNGEYTSSKAIVKKRAHSYFFNLSSGILDDLIQSDKELLKFNPVSKKSSSVQYCNVNTIRTYDQITSSMANATTDGAVQHRKSSSFYCMHFTLGNHEVKLFRQIFRNLKLKRSGFTGLFAGAEVDVIANDTQLFDQQVDFIEYNGTFYILSPSGLERIFDLSDQYRMFTRKVLRVIRKNKAIKNMKQFEEDCLSSKDAIKRIAKKQFEVKFDDTLLADRLRTKRTIDQHALYDDIKFNEDTGMIVYREPKQLSIFVSLINDSYVRSTMKGEYRIDHST